MNHHATNEDANTVSLFPFLAVLLCTMGALLVLLVVLAQRAGERVAAASATPIEPALRQALRENPEEAAQLEQQLAEVHAYQRQLAQLRKQAETRLREEQARLSHLEEHTRQLEHELARLSLAAQQLEATENNQRVDQQQAERELAHLQQLIQDTESQLEDLRKESQGKRSYAIVPYKGPNGTYRKPVYIECRKDAILLHPEGIRLVARDFADPSWPGNPLAAALRATRTYLNAQAASAGAPEPPDPYPLILVRPDGIRQYRLARTAITSWDTSFGYEFIDSDWKLSFPEEADPILARKQQHAILLARDQLERLIRSAPRRFRGMALGGNASTASGGQSGSYGSGNGTAEGEFSEGGPQLAESLQGGGSDNGNGFSENPSASEPNNLSEGKTQYTGGETQHAGGETEYGALTGNGDATTDPGQEGSTPGGDVQDKSGSGTGDRYAQSSSADANGDATSSSSGGSPGGSPTGSAMSGGRAASNGGASSSSSATASASIADSRGRNWAVEAGGRGSVPIRRTIQVVVRKDQLALLPNRHAIEDEATKGQVILLNQSQRQISDQFVAALRTRIEDWGLAGDGLYWRPSLKLHVGPDAEPTAKQVMRLLKNSGVELSLPDSARTAHGGKHDAPR